MGEISIVDNVTMKNHRKKKIVHTKNIKNVGNHRKVMENAQIRQINEIFMKN